MLLQACSCWPPSAGALQAWRYSGDAAALLLLPCLLLAQAGKRVGADTASGAACMPHQEQREAGHETLRVEVLASPIVILIHPAGHSRGSDKQKGCLSGSLVAVIQSL
jgi:hypothetical protein